MIAEIDPQKIARIFQQQISETLALDSVPTPATARRFSPTKPKSERARFDDWTRTHFLDNHLHHVLYCPIEKNACTYFRANMLLHSKFADEYRASKLNPHAFIKSRKRLLLKQTIRLRDPKYLKFVIVREPIERIVSAYANKFIVNRMAKMAVQATRQYANLNPVFEHPRRLLTFRMFVEVLKNYSDEQLDHHWRSQISFVAPVVDQFDWLVPMNRISDFLPILEQRLQTELPREKTANRNEYQTKEPGKRLYDRFPARLRLLDRVPGAESLMTAELRTALEQRFKLDFDLYELANKHFAAKFAQISR